MQKRLKLSAFPHQHHLVDINVALVITIMYSIKWQDRLWWTLLPASAVSELMMVPIGLQLMLCPPKDEGHIPPVIYGPPRAASSRKSGMLRHQAAARFQSKAEFLNPFEGDKNDEVAVLRYTGAWLRTTSTERRECMSSLVGRVLVTDSTPGSISRAHCLAAMVADYVEEKNISLGPVFPGTRAHMDKIPQGEPAPRTQKVTGVRGNTAVRSQTGVSVSQVGGGAIKLASSTEPGSDGQDKVQIRRQACSGDNCTRKVRFWTANPGVYEAAALCVEQ